MGRKRVSAAGAARAGPGWADGESYCCLYSIAKVPPKANRTSISLIALARFAGVHQRHLYRRVMPCARVDGDCRRPVVAGFRGHDIGHKTLRIAVVERKPCTRSEEHTSELQSRQ